MFSIDRPDSAATILDLDMATLGDSLVELGTLLSYWPADGSSTSRSPTIDLDMSGFPHRDELIEHYRQRGFDLESVDWCEAFGLWKLAVVLKQLHWRQDTYSRSAAFGASTNGVLMSAAAMVAKYTQSA